jgi:long-subunit acyl-CoA synthetase (AMP-forming)/acyl carrier protein
MKKELREYIEINHSTLENSNKTFEDIFEIMFRVDDLILAETNDGFRIKKYSYGDIKKRIMSASVKLYNIIGSGNYVGLEMENCVEWIVAFWAVLRSGNKPYLINCRHPNELSNGIIKTLNIESIIGREPTKLNAKYIDITEIDSENPDGDDFSISAKFGDEIALSTSATTMKEVICFYSGRQLSNQILNAKAILSESKRLPQMYNGAIKQLAFLPFYHVFGLIAVYFWFTFFGRTMVFLRDYSPDTILKTCKKHEVTHLFAVPMLWHTMEQKLLKEIEKRNEMQKFQRGLNLSRKLQTAMPKLGFVIAKRIMKSVTDELLGPSIKFCISGGSYLKQSSLELFNLLGYPLHNGYGMSEIGISSVELRDSFKDRCENSIGHPFASVKYSVDDKGILTVEGDSVCERMMINGEEIYTKGKICTGDIVWSRGDYYFIKGRESDLVIGDNGENINPDVIEQNFSFDSVLNFSVLGLGETQDDEILSLVLQINEYLPKGKIEDIYKKAEEINNTLPLTSRVRKIYFTYDAIISDGAIKVSRKYLKNKISSGDVKLLSVNDIINKEKSGGFDEDSAIVKKVKEIVANELSIDVKDINYEDNILTTLGGTSLQYFSIVSTLAEEFSIDSYSDDEEMQYTIKGICEYIERFI